MKLIYAIPATLALCYRARKHNSLTPLGIVCAAITALVHAYHPYNLPFILLLVFYLAGSRVTKVKHNIKANLTLGSKGAPGGEGPRNHIQVFANSGVASILCLLHGYALRHTEINSALGGSSPSCYQWGHDIFLVGIIANYAATIADTLGSELGILSTAEPRLITSLTLRRVPRGTNGGVSIAGLLAGLAGSILISLTSMAFLPVCDGNHEPGWFTNWSARQSVIFFGGLSIWGLLGSLVDSFLGALLQSSVRDVSSGKIIEGDGGKSVPTHADGEHGKDGDNSTARVVVSGWDLLDNNQVNFVMALSMSVGAMVLSAHFWEISLYDALAIW